MKDNIRKLKLELKQLAKQIKEKKSHRKDRMPDGSSGCGFVSGLQELRAKFRHKHVAYGLARGRKLEQMDSGSGLNMEWVNFILESLKPETEKRLYVVVKDSLSPSQQAVQAGHAVAEFLKKHPHTQWNNGHLIYLKTGSSWRSIRHYLHWQLDNFGEYAEFCEPDLNNAITAYACYGPYTEKIMKSLKLL